MGLRHEKNRSRAVQQIETIRNVALSSDMAAIVWYRGLTAKDMYDLQLEARRKKVFVKVIRNRLAHRALEDTPFACLQKGLEGPTLLALSDQGPKVVASLLRDFQKTHDKLVVKNLAFEKQLLPAEDLDSMADLPTKEEALATFMLTLQSPVRQLLSVLSAPQQQLIRAVLASKNS